MGTHLIMNCGLIALRNITSMEDISVRTLINLAEDNEIELFPYSIKPEEINKVELPAIFHHDNHFVFVDNKEILKDFENHTCVVLLTSKSDQFEPVSEVEKIKGASWVAAGVASAELTYGVYQKVKANQLKKSNYVPPQLLMNKDLDMQQAYSRRAPGAAFAEEQNRRLAANQIAGAQRMFGGDANKVAAVSAGATQGAQDANSRIAAQGQQFSENAFGKVRADNQALASNDRINQNQYLQTKAALDNAGNTNIDNSLNKGASAFIGSSGGGGGGGANGGMNFQDVQVQQYPQMNTFSSGNYLGNQGGSNPYGSFRRRRINLYQ